jgi:hypothetical protein
LNREHLGEKWGIGTLRSAHLGWLALRQHDFKGNEGNCWAKVWVVRMETNDKGGIAWCLEKLAEAKFEQSHFQRSCGRIWGMRQHCALLSESVIDGADQPDYDRMISEASNCSR